MFGFKKDKINFFLNGLSQEKKNELISVQKWMNGLIENDGFKVPDEREHSNDLALTLMSKTFDKKKWLGNYSQQDGKYGSSKTIGPAMITKEFERKLNDNYKFNLECKIAVVFDLGAIQHFLDSDKYLKFQGLDDYQIQNRYTNFDLETPFYLYHFHFSKKKEVYKYLDEQDDPDYKSLKTVYDHFIERADKLTDLAFKIDGFNRFPTEIFDTYNYHNNTNSYGEAAIFFHGNEKKDTKYSSYNIFYKHLVTDLRSDFETLKQNYKSWTDEVQDTLKFESLTMNDCKNISLGSKIYIKPRNLAPKQRKKIFYYTDPNSFNNSIYEIDKRFEKNIYKYAETPKIHDEYEDIEFHLWIYNPIASDYDMNFEKQLEYYKKYFEKEGYEGEDILKKSIPKVLDVFEKYTATQEEWKSKSFENKYINKLEMDKIKSLNHSQEMIELIASNRKKYEDYLWYNRDTPKCLTIEQKYYLKKKIFNELHLDNPNYSNGLNDKEKFSWTWLKEVYDRKYNFD